MRVNNWSGELYAFLDRASEEPFVWGSHDCCLFAVDAVRAVTGEDPARWFRGRYTTSSGAVRTLRRYLSNPPSERERLLEEVLVKVFSGFPQISEGFASRGDLVFFRDLPDTLGDWSYGVLGVCLGQNTAVAAGPGFALAETGDADVVWKV